MATQITSPPPTREPSRKHLALGALIAFSLLFFALGWHAAEWTLSTRRLSLPDRLHEGMTRQEVEGILRAPTLKERNADANGEVVVEYIIEYLGVAPFAPHDSFLIYVRFDDTGKLKSVYNCRTDQFSK